MNLATATLRFNSGRSDSDESSDSKSSKRLMLNSVEASILATLAYSDIFDFPLTFHELNQKLVFKKITKDSLSKILQQLVNKKKILKFARFYQLAGIKRLSRQRLQREKYAQKKLNKAKLAAKFLSLIPYVKFVGISGALAVGNTPKDDDIDLFVITDSGKIFTTRFFCNLLLDFLRFRRKPKSDKVTDKICLNMFLAENDLKLAPHDVYLAYEILQTKPLFERDDTYQKFLAANSWVFKFLPNWRLNAQRLKTKAKHKRPKALVVRPLALVIKHLALVVENTLKSFQLKYMEKKITSEVISDTKLFFHPADVHQKVLAEFEKRLKGLGILLDKYDKNS